MEDKKQITAEEILDQSNACDTVDYFNVDHRNRQAIIEHMEQYASIEVERTLNEAIEEINKVESGSLQESLGLRKAFEILTKLKDAKQS